MRAVVLLRGMNTGGVRFAMADLGAALEADGCGDVRTVLASGNVVLTMPEDEPAAIARRVSDVIRRSFGLDVPAIAASVAVVREAVEEYPFPRADDRHAYVVFADRSGLLAELLESGDAIDPAVEQVQPGEDVLYWDAPKGETLTTVFGRRMMRRQRDGSVTTRNIRTLEKIVAAG